MPKNVSVQILIIFSIFFFRTINDGPYWSKSLEFALDMLSLPDEELITLYKSAMLKYSDSPDFIHIIVVKKLKIIVLNNSHQNNLIISVNI